MSPWLARGSFRSCRVRKQCLRTHCSRAFSTSYVFFARVMPSWWKKLPPACTICIRHTKYSYITRGKSVCVRVECSIAEGHTLGWEANRSVGYCLPCAGAAPGAGQNEFCNRHPSDDIEQTALENESLGEEHSDNSLWATNAMTLNIFTFHLLKQETNQ